MIATIYYQQNAITEYSLDQILDTMIDWVDITVSANGRHNKFQIFFLPFFIFFSFIFSLSPPLCYLFDFFSCPVVILSFPTLSFVFLVLDLQAVFPSIIFGFPVSPILLLMPTLNLQSPAVKINLSVKLYYNSDLSSYLLGGTRSLRTITLEGIACIIMRKVYATMGESIYPNPSSLSNDFPEASRRLLRNLKEFTFQAMVN